MENLFKALRDMTHSRTRPPIDLVRNINLGQVVSSNAPLQQEELRNHQRELSLKFVRRIQEFTQGFGDSLVVIGDQGCGGMARVIVPQGVAEHAEGVFHCDSSQRVQHVQKDNVLPQGCPVSTKVGPISRLQLFWTCSFLGSRHGRLVQHAHQFRFTTHHRRASAPVHSACQNRPHFRF